MTMQEEYPLEAKIEKAFADGTIFEVGRCENCSTLLYNTDKPLVATTYDKGGKAQQQVFCNRQCGVKWYENKPEEMEVFV